MRHFSSKVRRARMKILKGFVILKQLGIPETYLYLQNLKIIIVHSERENVLSVA